MTRLDSIGLDYVPQHPNNETLLGSVVMNSLFIANRLIDEFIREPKILCTRKDANWILSNIYMTTVLFKCGRPPVQYPSPLQRSQLVKLNTHWHLVQRLSRRALSHQSAWSSASEDLPSSPPLHAYKLSLALLRLRGQMGSTAVYSGGPGFASRPAGCSPDWRFSWLY
jgi:hypothetical protein